MRRMYSHLGEDSKILLANYLCIGFTPGGVTSSTGLPMLHPVRQHQ